MTLSKREFWKGWNKLRADICIRVFDLSEQLGAKLNLEILSKMDKNKNRQHKHGKKA